MQMLEAIADAKEFLIGEKPDIEENKDQVEVLSLFENAKKTLYEKLQEKEEKI
jgi:hypothetical protein